MTDLHPVIAKVTERITERSAATRLKYLDLIERGRDAGTNRAQLSCGNLAHGFAASGEDKAVIRTGRAMNSPRRAARPLPSARPAMKLESTRLDAQTPLPNARPACRNQSVSNSRPAAPERKKTAQSTRVVTEPEPIPSRDGRYGGGPPARLRSGS